MSSDREMDIRKTDEEVPAPAYLRYLSGPLRDAAGILTDSGIAIASALGSPAQAARVRARTSDPGLLASLHANYDCISYLVSSELDPSGEGGPGVTFDPVSAPHFASHFARGLTRDAVTALRPLMETLCLQGFAAGAAYDCVAEGGPAIVRRRTPADVLPHWLFEAPGARHKIPNDLEAFMDAAGGVTLQDLLGLTTLLGVVQGPGQRRQAAVVKQVGSFLLRSGAGLYPYLTSRTDGLYA